MMIHKPNLLIPLTFSILAFVSGFGISYQQDIARVKEVGQLAWLHLEYAEELKDDMAIIDWSKNLQKLDGILAFQALNDTKLIAEGGNRNFLPAVKKLGVSYLFPAKWIFDTELTNADKMRKEFTMVYRAWPGPLIWGLFTFLLCFVVGVVTPVLAAFFSPVNILKPPPSPTVSKPKVILPAVQPQNPSPSKNEKPFLFLDKNYVIQQVTPEAAKLLRRNADDLVNVHLFDLDPDPSLMQGIEKAEETKILKPILSNPNLSAFLKPDPNGTLLYLESVE